MNFKALALTAALTAGSIFGTVSQARPSSCWMGNRSRLDAQPCDVARRVNSNGVIYWSINRGQFNVVLYGDNTAQVYEYGDGYNGNNWYTWHYDSDGDIRLSGRNNFQLIFRR